MTTEIRLTKAQTRVLEMIREAIRVDGRPPTRAEIATALGYRSVNAAESHLRALERRGAIRLHNGASRGIQCLLDVDDPDTTEIGLPVIGRVAAGVPIDSQAHIERVVPVQPHLFTTRPDYLLTVHGDSMQGIGILDGDLLAVLKRRDAANGDIVVARVDGEVTVKRLRIEAHRVLLIAENPAYAPIEVHDPDSLLIEGLAVGVIRTHLH